MTLILHELRRAWKSLAIWTAAIGAFIVICLVMYPEMKSQMDGISALFSSTLSGTGCPYSTASTFQNRFCGCP